MVAHRRTIVVSPSCNPWGMVSFCTMYGFRAWGHLIYLIFLSSPILPIENACNVPSGDHPTTQELHCRMVAVILCCNGRAKEVPVGVFLHCLMGSWGPPKLPQFFTRQNLQPRNHYQKCSKTFSLHVIDLLSDVYTFSYILQVLYSL